MNQNSLSEDIVPETDACFGELESIQISEHSSLFS
jgi:hypothetical protein